MVKPFSVPELMARVKAMLRRARPEVDRLACCSAGDIELDRETHRVRRNGRELHLGPTEFRLLEFLMQAPGRVFSREQLLDGVWGQDVYVDERTVDVHIGRLRKALNRRQRCAIRSAPCAAPATPSTRVRRLTGFGNRKRKEARPCRPLCRSRDRASRAQRRPRCVPIDRLVGDAGVILAIGQADSSD